MIPLWKPTSKTVPVLSYLDPFLALLQLRICGPPPPPLRSGQGGEHFFANVSEHFKTEKKCNKKKKFKTVRNCFENHKKNVQIYIIYVKIKKKIGYVSDDFKNVRNCVRAIFFLKSCESYVNFFFLKSDEKKNVEIFFSR